MSADEYHRLLMATYPPGAFSDTLTSLHGDLVLADADAFDAAQDVVDQLALEIFPHTTEDDLAEWEAFFRIDVDPNATAAARREALLGRARAAMGPRPADLRAMLAGVLNPEFQFKDQCDDLDVSWRYELDVGNGTVTETANGLEPMAVGGNDCSWDGTAKNAPSALLPLVDREDDMTIQGYVNARTINADTACGLVLFGAWDSCYLFGPWDVGGVTLIRAFKIEDGVMTQLDTAVEAAPPYWLQIDRISGNVVFRHGAALGALTVVAEANTTIKPRKCGVFALNGGVLNEAAVSIAPLQFFHGRQENNVELIEANSRSIPAAYQQAAFIAFVHRDPSDAGTYDIAAAQRIVDRAKQGHVLIMVGESDNFLTNDPHSLTNRDVLG